MDNKFSNAASLGYASLFISLWLWFMSYAGWIAAGSTVDLIPAVMFIGAVLLAIAGFFSFFNGDKIEPVLFFVIAAFIFSFAIRFVMYPNLPANNNPVFTDGWTHFLTALVVFILWMSSKGSHNYKKFFMLCFALAELGGAISNWTAVSIITTISGYIGLIAAVFAGLYFYSTVSAKGEASS